MKKNLSLLALFLLIISCDDGDLTVETIDFDSITTVQSCDAISPTLANILFKINAEEALILELPALAIENEIKTDTLDVNPTGNTKVTYRIFSTAVDQLYFCSDIPLTEPIVINEIVAKNGKVIITTTLDANNETTYNHTIKLQGISLVTSNNSRITDLSVSDFGQVTTIQQETTTEK